MIAIPVQEHITRVSMKLDVIVTRPCLTGLSVIAEAAAIGAEPRHVSLEKTPLEIPFCIHMKILPMTPPVTALGLKAP